MVRKTKRRRQGKLGSSTEEHDKRAVQAAEESLEWSSDAIDDANKGKCSRAVQSLGLAAERLGRARAHVLSTTHGGTPAAEKAEGAARIILGQAEETLREKCLIPSRVSGVGETRYDFPGE